MHVFKADFVVLGNQCSSLEKTIKLVPRPTYQEGNHDLYWKTSNLPKASAAIDLGEPTKST